MLMSVLTALAILNSSSIQTSQILEHTVPVTDQTQALATQPNKLSSVSVRVRCTARADGAVTDCSVISETLPGLGFGETAVALMNGATIEPAVENGRPVDTVFEHTIEFMP